MLSNILQSKVLEKVLSFASKAHGEQRRKFSNELFIHHPIRVMNSCREFTDEIPVLAAALLHDILEDTAVTRQELRSFLNSIMEKEEAAKTLDLVVELTDVYTKERFPRLNRRARKRKEAERLSAVSPEAQTIKYADIIDNTVTLSAQDMDFAREFVKEGKKMLSKMNDGNPELHRYALKVVEEALSGSGQVR